MVGAWLSSTLKRLDGRSGDKGVSLGGEGGFNRFPEAIMVMEGAEGAVSSTSFNDVWEDGDGEDDSGVGREGVEKPSITMAMRCGCDR